LPYRRREDTLEVLIAHMGGPFWARKDEGAWTIVKGEYDPGEEEPLAAARREFVEETGEPAPDGEPLALGELRQSSGKRIVAWAVEVDELDPDDFVSNTFTLEWPRGSGTQQQFPEIDRAAWLDLGTARGKLLKGQVPFLDALELALG
jgi:predicted NUDIX family NTP pyrophosphohydrolase